MRLLRNLTEWRFSLVDAFAFLLIGGAAQHSRWWLLAVVPLAAASAALDIFAHGKRKGGAG